MYNWNDAAIKLNKNVQESDTKTQRNVYVGFRCFYKKAIFNFDFINLTCI